MCRCNRQCISGNPRLFRAAGSLPPESSATRMPIREGFDFPFYLLPFTFCEIPGLPFRPDLSSSHRIPPCPKRFRP